MKKAYLLLLFPSMLFARIEIQSSITNVYHQGDHEAAGSVTMTVTDNEFSAATPDQPIFIQVKYDQGAVNGHTLVDLGNDDETLSKPVFLAMEFVGQSNDLQMVASPETVSIVRWVEGEDDIWLRIQTSSDSWLMDAQGNPLSPGTDRRVAWTFGISASSSDASIGPNSNLPFNSRNPTPTGTVDAISTIRCIDLSNSSLAAEGTASLLYQDIIAFEADAQIGDGIFRQGSYAGINITGTFRTARGNLRQITATTYTREEGSSLDERDGYPIVRRMLELALSERSGVHYVESGLLDGATLTLRTMGNSGFIENGAVFSDGCDSSGVAVVNPETAFEMDGRTVYREITLIWSGGLRRIADLRLSVLVSLSVPMGNHDALPELTWELQQSDRGIPDWAPYDGPEQLRACRQSSFKIEGTWQPLTLTAYNDRFLPHITRHDGSFETSVDLVNPHDSGKGYLISGFSTDGRWLGTHTGLLAAGERRTLPPAALFDDPELSHLRVSVVSSVSIGLTYRARGVGKVAASVPEVQRGTYSWLIWPGNPAVTFDGLALVNLGNDDTEVTLEEINAAGEVVETTVLEEALAPMGKLLHVLRPSAEGTYFLVNSGNQCVVTALRGNTDAGFLWVNRALDAYPF